MVFAQMESRLATSRGFFKTNFLEFSLQSICRLTAPRYFYFRHYPRRTSCWFHLWLACRKILESKYECLLGPIQKCWRISTNSFYVRLSTLRQTPHLPWFLRWCRIFVFGRRNRREIVASLIGATDSLDQSNSVRKDPLNFNYCKHLLVFDPSCPW